MDSSVWCGSPSTRRQLARVAPFLEIDAAERLEVHHLRHELILRRRGDERAPGADFLQRPGLFVALAPGDGGGNFSYSSNQVVLRIQKFLETVKASTGRDCIIYTYRYAWNSLTGNSNAFAANNPLWIAAYGVVAPQLVGNWPG